MKKCTRHPRGRGQNTARPQGTIFGAILAALILVGPPGARGDFPWIEGGRPAPLVADRAEAEDPDLAQAIADLRDWLRAASGQSPELLLGPPRPTGPVILIGKPARDSRLEVPPDPWGGGSYAIRVDATTLALAGRTPAGTANAIYDAAARYLGVRVHGAGPDGVRVPKQAALRVRAETRREEPALELRQAWYNENVLAGASPAHRQALKLFARRHRSGGARAVIRHYFSELVPPSVFKEHPEYFAEIGGQRVADGQLCTSNTEVIAIAADHWIDRFRREPDLEIGSLSPNDGSRFCTCTACKSGGPDLTARYVRFANEVTARVAGRYPDRYLSFYAYADLVEPPYDKGLSLNANLIPVVARFSVCQVHAIDERACASNAAFKRRLEGWAAISRQIMARDYACMWPVPDLTFKVLAANLRTYHRLGARGMSREYLMRGFMSDLLMAVDLELQWNPAANADSILADLCGARYGPAAPAVLTALEGLRRPIENVPADRAITGDEQSAAGLYRAEDLAPVVDRFDQLARTEPPPARTLLQQDAALLRAAMLRIEATAALDRFKRSGRDEDRAAATAKTGAARQEAARLAGAGVMGNNAVTDLDRMQNGIESTGLAAPLSGKFDYEDDLARGGFSRRDADLIEGFYPGTYGLSLHPLKSGRVAYTFKAAPGQRFASAEIHHLVLRGSSARIEVKADGRVSAVADGVALDNQDLTHDLTPWVAGKDRFTLIFSAQNSSDKAMLCLDHFAVRGEVR